MSEATNTKTFRAQGDTGVVYTVVETQSAGETGEKETAYALSDGRKVEKTADSQFEIVDTKELITVI